MLTHRPYAVRYVISHFEMHEDELNAYCQATLLKPDMFPGIDKAPLQLMDAGLHPETGKNGNHYLENAQTICIGVCGGQFDEHAQDGKENKSAASCMAKWLGLENDPSLRPFLEYSLQADRKASVKSFELPNLIKAWWLVGVNVKDGLAMYKTIFFALIRKFSGAQPRAQVEAEQFRFLVAEWFVERFVPAKDRNRFSGRFATGEAAAIALNRIDEDVRPIIDLDTRQGDFRKTDFDLEGLYEAMTMAGVPFAERRRIVFTSLYAKYAEQLDFLAARAEFKAKAAYAEMKNVPYSVVVVHSDSRSMNKAARWEDPDADVLVQFHKSGRYRIFDLHKRLRMQAVAAQVRIAELQLRRGKPLPMRALLSEGTLREVPQCFYWGEGNGVFNGTNTAPNTPVTRMKPKQLLEALDAGLIVSRKDGVISSRANRANIERHRQARKAARAAKVAQTDGSAA